jgi:hypothetical protein
MDQTTLRPETRGWFCFVSHVLLLNLGCKVGSDPTLSASQAEVLPLHYKHRRKFWSARKESDLRIVVLQTTALPLGYERSET